MSGHTAREPVQVPITEVMDDGRMLQPEWEPPTCGHCGNQRLKFDGSCGMCDPLPVLSDVRGCLHEAEVSIGWKTKRKLDGGRMATVVHRRNFCLKCYRQRLEG